jgi:hypothetical protein
MLAMGRTTKDHCFTGRTGTPYKALSDMCLSKLPKNLHQNEKLCWLRSRELKQVGPNKSSRVPLRGPYLWCEYAIVGIAHFLFAFKNSLAADS